MTIPSGITKHFRSGAWDKAEDNAGGQEEEDTGKNIDQEQADADTSLPDEEEAKIRTVQTNCWQ